MPPILSLCQALLWTPTAQQKEIKTVTQPILMAEKESPIGRQDILHHASDTFQLFF